MLTAIDSERVTAVGDTEEAGMCVDLANLCYEMMTSKKRWRHFRKYGSLTTTANLNEMDVPTGTTALDPYNVWYDGARVEWKEPEEFLMLCNGRNEDDDNVTTINGLKIITDTNPSWFTSDNDETLRFDSIPDPDDGLTASNFQVLIYQQPTSRLSLGTAYFDLPAIVYPALVLWCRGIAKIDLKGDTAGGQTDVAEAKKTIATLNRTARLVDVQDDLRKWIVPRRSSQNLGSSPRLYGNRLVY